MTQYLSYAIEPDGIATITWHAPGPGPNTFNDVSMAELESAVRTLLADPAVRGMVVTSSKEDFIVGADLQMLRRARVVPRSQLAPETCRRRVDGVLKPGSNWLQQRDSGMLFGFGRLKPGVTPPQAQAALNALMANLAREHPQSPLLEGARIDLAPPGLVLPALRNPTLSFAWVLMTTMSYAESGMLPSWSWYSA